MIFCIFKLLSLFSLHFQLLDLFFLFLLLIFFDKLCNFCYSLISFAILMFGYFYNQKIIVNYCLPIIRQSTDTFYLHLMWNLHFHKKSVGDLTIFCHSVRPDWTIFGKILVTNFLSKVAQILNNCWGHFRKWPFINESVVATFWANL